MQGNNECKYVALESTFQLYLFIDGHPGQYGLAFFPLAKTVRPDPKYKQVIDVPVGKV